MRAEFAMLAIGIAWLGCAVAALIIRAGAVYVGFPLVLSGVWLAAGAVLVSVRRILEER